MLFNLRNKPVLSCLSILIAIILAVGIVISQVHYPAEDFSNDQAYPVLRVIDGDTIETRYDGQAVSVRLIGVDRRKRSILADLLKPTAKKLHPSLRTYC